MMPHDSEVCHICNGAIWEQTNITIECIQPGYDHDEIRVRPLCWECFLSKVKKPLEKEGIVFDWKSEHF